MFKSVYICLKLLSRASPIILTFASSGCGGTIIEFEDINKLPSQVIMFDTNMPYYTNSNPKESDKLSHQINRHLLRPEHIDNISGDYKPENIEVYKSNDNIFTVKKLYRVKHWGINTISSDIQMLVLIDSNSVEYTCLLAMIEKNEWVIDD